MIGRPGIAIGVGASAVAALLLSAGTIVQALDAREVEHHHGLRISMLGRLLSRPRWVIGTAIGYAAFPFQLIALAHAPLVIVQPIHACGLLLLMAAGARMFREHIHTIDLGGVVAIVAGLVLVTWGAPAGPDPPVSEVALGAATGGLILLGLVPYGFRRQSGRNALIVSAAIAFAGTNLAVKGISHALGIGDYPLLAGYLLAAAAGSTIGVLSQMTAFQRHRAVEVVPLTFSIPTFLPALLGLLVLREDFATALGGGIMFAAGAIVLLLGTVAVSRSAPVTSVSEHAAHE